MGLKPLTRNCNVPCYSQSVSFTACHSPSLPHFIFLWLRYCQILYVKNTSNVSQRRLLWVKKCSTLWSQCRAYHSFHTERLLLKASWPEWSWVLRVCVFPAKTHCKCACVHVRVFPCCHRGVTDPQTNAIWSWPHLLGSEPPSSLTTHTTSQFSIKPSLHPPIQSSEYRPPPPTPPSPPLLCPGYMWGGHYQHVFFRAVHLN